MAGTSSIEWTATVHPDGTVTKGKTWNPTVGCTRVSPGCEHCYAETLAPRLAAMGQPVYAGLTRQHGDGSRTWTGEVKCLPERLPIPLRWKKPQRVFVNSMSDLFHEAVPDTFIDQVFAVMSMTPWHTYQVLTKRPERAAKYLDPNHAATAVHLRVALASHAYPPALVKAIQYVADQLPEELREEYVESGTFVDRWPLPNVWLGVSTEDQAAADARIPHLLEAPAAVRFLSCEPLLGPIDLSEYLGWECQRCGERYDDCDGDWRWISAELKPDHRCYEESLAPNWAWGRQRIAWVITGGESGPHHRHFDPDWARGIRDQCAAAGVSYFHKQNGGLTPKAGGRLLDGVEWNQFPESKGA